MAASVRAPAKHALHNYALVSTAAPVNLFAFDHAGLQDYLAGLGEKPYRAKQLMQWLYARGVREIDDMSDVSKKLRARRLRLNAVRHYRACQKITYRRTARANGCLNCMTVIALKQSIFPKKNAVPCAFLRRWVAPSIALSVRPLGKVLTVI